MIGNIVAGTLSAGFVPVPNSYESIATVTVSSGGQLAVTFSSIPQTYKHLQIRANIGKASSGNNQLVLLYFNGSNANNSYKIHHLWGTGSSAVSNDFNNYPNSGSGALGLRPDNSVNVFTGVVADVLDYTNTSKNTTVRSLWGFDTNGTGNGVPQYGQVGITSTLWMNTSAVSSLTIEGFNGVNFPEYSHFALYGIKD